MKRYTVFTYWITLFKSYQSSEIDLVIPHNPNKNPSWVFCLFVCFWETSRSNLTFIWKCKESRLIHTILEKNKIVDLTLSDLKTYYKCSLTKNMCFWHMDRHTGQWNDLKNPEIDPTLWSNKNIQMAKKHMKNI